MSLSLKDEGASIRSRETERERAEPQPEPGALSRLPFAVSMAEVEKSKKSRK